MTNSHQDKTHFGLSEHDSGPPISTQSANNRVESPPRKSEPNLGTWGTPTEDMFATVPNIHLPQFMSPIPEPRALGVKLSPDPGDVLNWVQLRLSFVQIEAYQV